MKLYILFLLSFISRIAVSQIDYNDFRGTQSTIIFSKQYPFANLYDYGLSSKVGDSIILKSYGYEISEEALMRKYNQIFKSNSTDTSLSKIILRSRLILDIDNERHVFIKYKLVTNGVRAINFEVVDLVNSNGLWKEAKSSNEELEAIKSVFLNATVETIYAFYNKKDDPNKPEINKLKPLVKNDLGVLDIKLMDSVIKKNRNSLTKYLE
ncbi:MAG: hypothetical protein IM606_05975 [Cytophagales bacterium]|jgi:hypothetical protein|nr:hypothetical protein [Cytophagales bacterium]MCA6389644.1 hypothetical protein [Cytophagales bacterium]MCA6390410.1 hypothetical protein [Cytophagales bacterium]MCA6394718.1 hypothetical protein [Cytophagales bacterium]MCA6403585.1 hypothetical protein [Cytophagales bacterium]